MDKKGLKLLHRIWLDSTKGVWTESKKWDALSKKVYHYLKEKGVFKEPK